MTGLYPLPQLVLHRGRTTASSFYFRYPLFSLRLSSSCLRLLSRLSVTLILLSLQFCVLGDSFYLRCDQSS